MNDTDCIFCKIIAGELPATQIWEDEKTQVFLTIAPVNPGHMLVVPKEHHVNVFDLPEETFAAMARTSQKMAGVVKAALNTEDVNIYMNNGKDSGQVVFHSHIHIIPRYKGDGHALWHGTEYKKGEAAKVADQLKKAL